MQTTLTGNILRITHHNAMLRAEFALGGTEICDITLYRQDDVTLEWDVADVLGDARNSLAVVNEFIRQVRLNPTVQYIFFLSIEAHADAHAKIISRQTDWEIYYRSDYPEGFTHWSLRRK
jgi:hypothetical protein